MKKLFAVTLLIVLLCQALPVEALAAVGNVLSQNEIDRARALTGLSFGRDQNGERAYHSGMKPNAGWNAVQLRGWLDEKLDRDLDSICDTFSHAFFTLADMKMSNSQAHRRLADAAAYKAAKSLSEKSEALRENLRFYRDRIRENSGVIAEMSRWLTEESSRIFDSDKVRYSARIREAEKTIRNMRDIITQNADSWESEIAGIKYRIQSDASYGFDGIGIKTWLEAVLSEDEAPVTRTAPITRTSGAASRTNRLQMASGLLGDADAQITVYTDNEVVIQVQAESGGTLVPVDDAKVTYRDALDPASEAEDRYPDEGAVLIPINNLTSDEYDVYHLAVDIDGTASGYQHVVFENLDIERGTVYTCLLTPIGQSAANADGGRPYPSMMSFDTKDIMKSEYEMIYSPANDYEIEIHLGVENADAVQSIKMRYYDLDGDACDVDPTDIAGNEYIFKGPWKQRFSPFATEDQRPAFIITDTEGTQTFPSQLVSMKGATDEPINEGTGAEGGVFANVLGDPLQLSCKIPIIDATVSLTLPLTEYLPKVTINPGGYVVIYVGSELLEDDFGEHDKTSWRIKDGKEYQREQKKKEAEGWFAKYKSDYDQAKDFAKTKGFGLIKQTDLMMGWFGVASGRWELDNSLPDILSKDISLRVGTGLTWTFTVSYTVTYAIPPFAVPAYATVYLGISCGIGIEFTLEMSWVNGTFQTWKLFPLKNTTVDIGIILGVQVGVGIKGFLDAYVKVAASLDFIMNLSTADPSTAELDGGIDLTVGATVFFISASKTWHLASGRIWPSNSAANLLQHFMKAGDEEPEVQEAVHDEPFSYPALAAEAEEEAWTWRAQSEGYPFKIVDVNGFRFAFSIYKATGKDGKQHSRVGYCRIDSDSDSFGATPMKSLQEFIDQNTSGYHDPINEREDYDFDVCATDKYVIVAATSAKEFDENGYPVRNDLEGHWQDRYLNQIIYIILLECDDNSNLIYDPDSWKDLQCESYQCIGDDTHLDCNYDSLGTPRITCARITWADPSDHEAGWENFELYGYCDRIAYPDDPNPAGLTAFSAAGVDRDLSIWPSRAAKSGMGDDYEFAKAELLLDIDAVDRTKWEYEAKSWATSFVGLSRPKDGAEGDNAIELYGFDMNKGGRRAIVLDQGVIGNIVAVKDREVPEGELPGTTVFYTRKETNGDGAERNRLWGIHIGPVTGEDTSDLEYDVTRYEYDVVMPTSDFDICYMNSVPYLYWVTNAPKKQESDPDVWRVWVMLYDSVTNSLASPAVFSEFTLPKIEYTTENSDVYYDEHPALKNVIMTGTGTNYLNAAFTDPESIPEEDRPKRIPISLCSFPEQLKPSASVISAIPKELLVKAGSFDDFTMGVVNDGSLAIASLDLAMYEVTESGDENLVETAHIDALDPTKNTITMADGTVVQSGEAAGYREEDYDSTPRRRDWVLDHEALAYKIHVDGGMKVDTETIEPSNPQHVRTDILMPGSTGGYTASYKIPEDWNGGKKTLRMKVTSASTFANWMRAAALASGARANGTAANANANGELVELKYVLNEKTGRLELQKPANLTASLAEAIRSGLIASAFETGSAPVTVTVHDLEVDHRVYRGPGGERWLDIIVRNHAATREGMKLVCAVYVDGAKEPEYINLPCYDNAPLGHRTQTISLPVSALVDDPGAHSRARVEILSVGRDERALANNEFTVMLGGNGALRFVKQPEDATVQEGEDVSFEVEVAGGRFPYTYQWQVWDPKHEKWVDLPGFTGPTLSRKDIEKKWNGARFRCVVTDANGTQIISREAILTVRDRVPTGDSSNLPLYLAVAIAALAMLWWVRRRRIG